MIEEAKDPTKAQNKNYFGRQIERQKEEGRAQVIQAPKYKGYKADPYEADSKLQPHEAAVAQKHHQGHDRGHLIDDAKSHTTDMSNKTNKMATNEYYTDLTDKVLNMYDDSHSNSGPYASGDRHESANVSER